MHLINSCVVCACAVRRCFHRFRNDFSSLRLLCPSAIGLSPIKFLIYKFVYIFRFDAFIWMSPSTNRWTKTNNKLIWVLRVWENSSTYSLSAHRIRIAKKSREWPNRRFVNLTHLRACFYRFIMPRPMESDFSPFAVLCAVNSSELLSIQNKPQTIELNSLVQYV